jgi:hypothetical protein
LVWWSIRFGEFRSYSKANLISTAVGRDTSTFMMMIKQMIFILSRNFGSVDFMETSVPFLAEVLMTVDRLKE